MTSEGTVGSRKYKPGDKHYAEVLKRHHFEQNSRSAASEAPLKQSTTNSNYNCNNSNNDHAPDYHWIVVKNGQIIGQGWERDKKDYKL